MKPSRAEFIEQLHALKEASPLSYKALASKLDSSVSTVHGWCTGKHLPYPRETARFESLLRELGVSDTDSWLETLTHLRRRSDDSNPYLGLAAYTEVDTNRFHGRSRLTDALISGVIAGFDAAVREPMLVVGPSGVGKTSLLRAGLAPGLARRGIADSHSTTPGPNPADCLAAIETWISARDGQRCVVIVDQFEEIFSPTNATVLDHFLSQLAAIAQSPNIQVVVGLRADFYQRAAGEPWLRSGLGQRHMLVTPLNRDETTECIVRPAEEAGIAVAPGLLVQLVSEFTEQTGLSRHNEALPLLSHVLFLLCEESPRVLTQERYDEIGGLHSAISQAAEAAYDALDERGRETCREIFTHLVELGDGGVALRRPLHLTTFEVHGNEASVDDVIEVFTHARLLTVHDNDVTISHETLLTGWGRLAGWIDDAREMLHVVRRISAQSAHWENVDRDPSGALRDALLDEALAILASAMSVRLTDAEITFIEESQGLRLNRQRHDAGVVSRQLALQSQQLRRNDPMLSAQIAVVAHRASPTLEARSALASATSPLPGPRSLGTSGEVRFDLSENESVGVASNGDDDTIRIFDCSGDDLRLRSLLANPSGERITAVAINSTGDRIAIGSSGGHIWIIDLDSDERRKMTVSGDFDGAIHALIFANHDRWLIAGGRGHAVVVFNPLTNHRVGTFPCPDTVLGLDICANTEAVAAASSDGSVTMWWSDTGDVLQCDEPWQASNPRSAPASCVKFDPKRKFVIVGHHDGRLRVWKTDDGVPTEEIALTSAPFSSWINDVAISPSGEHAAAASSDGSVRFFDTRTWEEVRPELTHGSVVTNVRFFGPGRIITAAENGTVRTWAPPPALSSGVDSTIWTIALDRTGNSVITASGGRCALWSTSGSTDLHVETVFEPGGELVFSGSGAISADAASVAFGTRTGEVMFGSPRAGSSLVTLPPVATSLIENVAFGHDGDTVAAIESAGQLHLWRVRSAAPALCASIPVPIRPLDLAFNVDSTLLAVVTETNQLAIFETADLDAIRQVSLTTVADSFAMSVAFHPSQPIVAIGSADRSLSMWDCVDPKRPKLLCRTTGAEGHQVAVAFDRDGTRIAAAGTDATVSIWDVADVHTPVLEYRLHGNGAGAYSVTFAPDADVCLGAGPNQQIDSWLLDPEEAIEALTLVGGDGITATEWSRYVPASVAFNPPA